MGLLYMFFKGERHAALLCFLILCFSSVLLAGELPGIHVDSRYLYDKNSEKILIRGMNMPELFQYHVRSGQLPEIAKTSANGCLIFCMTGHPPEPVIAPSALDKPIQILTHKKIVTP